MPWIDLPVAHINKGIHGPCQGCLQTSQDFLFNLILSAVNMGIVLLELSDLGETREGFAQFSSVQDPKVSVSNGQIPVGLNGTGKHEMHSMRQPKFRSWRQIMKHDQLLRLCNPSMIPLFCLVNITKKY
jgi:hypothetical protein